MSRQGKDGSPDGAAGGGVGGGDELPGRVVDPAPGGLLHLPPRPHRPGQDLAQTYGQVRSLTPVLA